MGKTADEQIRQLFNRITELENGLKVIQREAKEEGSDLIYTVASDLLKKD